MKALILFSIVLISFSTWSQFIQFGQEEFPKASLWVNPVGATAENGLHIGADLQMMMHWGWVAGSISNFSALEGGYTDVVASGGVNVIFFNFRDITYYSGPRLGVAFREGNPFPLIGGTAGFDIKVWKFLQLGLRAWADYRTDQANDVFGDRDSYKSGLISNSSVIQENAAIVMSIVW